MDLMFAAEQYAAHATAAAVAAAQYYALNAVGNPNSAATNMMVSSSGGFGLMSAPLITMAQHGLHTGMEAAAGPQFHMQQLIQQQPDGKERSRSRNDDDDIDNRGESRKDRRSDRHREKRERSRDRGGRGGERERSPREQQRRERSRRDRSRDRDRSPRRDRRERSPSCEDEGRYVPPNNTIMVRGLAQHITESDIRQDITDHGLIARDIRLIRKKETGTSRGFAFVEFTKLEDAKSWMDAKQGVLLFKDQYRAIMQYSLPRDGRPGDPPKVLSDWICGNCGVQNFRRRDHCFKCNGPKTDGGVEGADEVSSHPTGTVLLRNLDALSTEDSVLNCLKSLTQLPIKSIRIGRDPLTNTSRGVCYVEMNTVVDSMFLHNQLLGEPPTIDGRLVSVSYFRTPQNSPYPAAAAANAALAAAQWSHQGMQLQEVAATQPQHKYSDEDVERMAEYSASLYAKTAEEKKTYLDYYRNYYRNGGEEGGSSAASSAQRSTSPTSSSAANGGKGRVDKSSDLGVVMVDGVEYRKYPIPDVSTYTYDETSGYYYDSQTSLYYDVNSQYYFNSTANKFMYWSAEHRTYLPAQDQQEDKGKKEDKKDKVKTAKKIAKDMERWAKTLNQRKEAAKSFQAPATGNVPSPAIPGGSSSAGRSNVTGAEDIAYSMLHKKQTMSADASPSATGLAGLASYGSDSDEESGGANPTAAAGDESQLADWSKLACLLCKRQFPTKEKLQKHNQVSDLHKQNLDAWKRSQKGEQRSAAASSSLSAAAAAAQQYRDRAKERRQKYGEDDAPKPNRLKEKYLKVMEDVETVSLPERNIDSTNIGNKMLQKMGWKEGLGLGKANQGRTSIIEADRRAHQAGLGSGGTIKSNPNDSYKDCVKKTMFQRYQDLE